MVAALIMVWVQDFSLFIFWWYFFPLVKNIDSIKKIQKQNLRTIKRKNT